jgi:hypothetical protein
MFGSQYSVFIQSLSFFFLFFVTNDTVRTLSEMCLCSPFPLINNSNNIIVKKNNTITEEKHPSSPIYDVTNQSNRIKCM